VGVPAAIQVVQIDAAVIAFGYKDDAPAELQATIAHEARPRPNVYHHGETEYNVGDVVCKNAVTHPDGSVTLTGDVTNHMCSGKQPVHGHGPNNGVPRLTGAVGGCWVVAGKAASSAATTNAPCVTTWPTITRTRTGSAAHSKAATGVLLSDYGRITPAWASFARQERHRPSTIRPTP